MQRNAIGPLGLANFVTLHWVNSVILVSLRRRRWSSDATPHILVLACQLDEIAKRPISDQLALAWRASPRQSNGNSLVCRTYNQVMHPNHSFIHLLSTTFAIFHISPQPIAFKLLLDVISQARLLTKTYQTVHSLHIPFFQDKMHQLAAGKYGHAYNLTFHCCSTNFCQTKSVDSSEQWVLMDFCWPNKKLIAHAYLSYINEYISATIRTSIQMINLIRIESRCCEILQTHYITNQCNYLISSEYLLSIKLTIYFDRICEPN